MCLLITFRKILNLIVVTKRFEGLTVQNGAHTKRKTQLALSTTCMGCVSIVVRGNVVFYFVYIKPCGEVITR